MCKLLLYTEKLKKIFFLFFQFHNIGMLLKFYSVYHRVPQRYNSSTIILKLTSGKKKAKNKLMFISMCQESY
jgi:hypothetical protein